MKQGLAALCASAVGLYASAAPANVRPELAHTALAALADAKAVAAAGRGQLLMVGSTLATEQTPSENVVVVLEYPWMLTHPDKIYPGQVLRIPPLS